MGPTEIWQRFATGRFAPLVLVSVEALLLCWWAAGLSADAPLTNEDFSNLLAADTFARGRLANPPLEGWEHFESPGVLQQPRYASSSPPLPGLILAAGQRLGAPLLGSRICYALACAAATWMLRAWVGAGWALLGGLLLALHPQLALQFGNGYSAGAPAMLGGALVFGAAPRLRGAPRVRDSLLLGLGAGVLAMSRPYEGLALCAPIAVWLGAHARRRDTPLGRAPRAAIALPGALALLATGIFLGAHNARVTGSWLTRPSDLHQRTYAVAPRLLVFPRGAEKEHRHPALARLYGEEGTQLATYEQRRSPSGLARAAREKLSLYGRFFLLPALALPLLALPWTLRQPGVGLALATALVFAPALLIQTFEAPHFAAPFVGPGLFLVVVCLRRVWRLGAGRLRLGPVLVAALVAAGLQQQTAAAQQQAGERLIADLFDRPALERLMGRYGPRHLVFVRYLEGHEPESQWVHNAADLESAPVVWARQLGVYTDRELARRLPGRRLWLLTVRAGGTGLRPHPDRHFSRE